jgi:hypothetical protein
MLAYRRRKSYESRGAAMAFSISGTASGKIFLPRLSNPFASSSLQCISNIRFIVIVFLAPNNDAVFQKGVLLRSRAAPTNEPIIVQERHFNNYFHGLKIITRFLSVNPGKCSKRYSRTTSPKRVFVNLTQSSGRKLGQRRLPYKRKIERSHRRPRSSLL